MCAGYVRLVLGRLFVSSGVTVMNNCVVLCGGHCTNRLLLIFFVGIDTAVFFTGVQAEGTLTLCRSRVFDIIFYITSVNCRAGESQALVQLLLDRITFDIPVHLTF